MPNLGQRLAKLEEAARPNRGVVIMWRYDDETDEQAVSRWKAEHPGDDLDAADLRVTLIRWERPDDDPGPEPVQTGIPTNH